MLGTSRIPDKILGLDNVTFGQWVTPGEVETNAAAKDGATTVEAAKPAEPPVNGTAPKKPGTDTERFRVTLAASMAEALLEGIGIVQHQYEGENGAIRDILRQQREKLEAAVEGLEKAGQRINDLAGKITEQATSADAARGKQEQVGATVASLEQAWVEQQTAIEALKREAEALSVSMADRLDAVLGRTRLQEELTALKSQVTQLSEQIAGCNHRLDRQAEIVRCICEGQARGEAALDQFLEVLTRLKSVAVPLPNLAGVQL